MANESMPFGIFPDLANLSFNSSPGATIGGLSDAEQRTLQFLAGRLWNMRGDLLLSNMYYEGLQKVTNLGISLPPELKGLRAVLGWAEGGVEAIDERLEVQGFRLPGTTVADDDLWGIWEGNNLSAEQGLIHLDSLVYGLGHAVVGLDDDGDAKITLESPLNMSSIYDTRTRRTMCAYQAYVDPDPTSPMYAMMRAALYMPNATIHFVNDGKAWQITDRDDHNMNVVPVVSFVNRQRTGERFGQSEIRASWRNCIDRAARTFVSMEGIREFFGAPKMMILGAAEGAFQKADGTMQSAWDTYIGRVLALEADDRGNLPQVQRFAGEDPGAMIRLIDHETHMMAGLTGLPPQYLGIFSDGNPASADAIRMSDYRLQKKAEKKALQFGDSWEQVMRLAMLVRDGKIPDDMKRLETDWAPCGIPTPAADTDAMVKQISVGLLPATSDVALTKLGWTANQRDRIENERRKEIGSDKLASIMANALAKPPVAAPARIRTETPDEAAAAQEMKATAESVAPNAPVVHGS